MAALSSYFADTLLRHIVGLEVYTMPTWIYMGLCKAQGVEVSPTGTGYERFAAQPSHWTSASGGETHNNTAFAFPEATADWGLIEFVYFYDEGLAGTGSILMASALTTPRQIVAGSLPKFPINSISISETQKLSDYLEDKILNHIMGKVEYLAPSTIYVGLSSTSPLDSGAGISEPSGMSYARVATVASEWTLVVTGSLFNNTSITFPAASGDWGTMNYCALFDALSGGNMLAYGPLSVAKAIGVGQVAKFSAYPPTGSNLIINLS